MIGLEERDTQSGIHVFRIHYTADDNKRSEEWKQEAARGVVGGTDGQAWKREFEIDWTVASGLSVYGDVFVREMHIAKEPLMAYRDRPIYRGWDYGLTPACVWVQVDPSGRLNVLDELVTWSGRGPMVQQGIEQITPMVTLKSAEDWPDTREWRDVADPAGWQKAQTDEKSCVQVQGSLGVHPSPGPVSWVIRKRAMVDTLQKMSGGRAQIMVSPVCRMLIEGFGGAYRYQEIGETGRFTDQVEKNAWSHPMNALEYVVGKLYAPPVGEARPVRKRKPIDVTGY